MEALQEKVSALVEKAESAPNTADSDAYYQEAIRLFDGIDIAKLDSTLAYSLAYSLYNLSISSNEQKKLLEKALMHAIAKDKNNFYAVLYFGHYCFDAGRFEDALKYFLTIPDRYFSTHGQAWRDLKKTELILCCYLQLGASDDAANSLEQLISESSNLDPIDRPELTELRTTLRKLIT